MPRSAVRCAEMFDSHAHYDDEAFDGIRDSLINDLHENKNVKGFINIGCSIDSSKTSLALAEKYPFVYAAVGIHPEEAENFKPSDLAEIETMLRNKKAVAIGEIGLDYHYGTDFRDKQIEMFRLQLELAEKTGKPVIIHERDSVADCLECVLDYDVTGVFHSYSGSAETAKILLKKGFYISFSGTVTFKNARLPVENAKIIPDDRILVETDCPYLTPHPFRGKRNDSGYMRYTLEKLAEIRGVSFEHIEQVTEENAKRLFSL